MFGDAGNDSLIGGVNDADNLDGGTGDDRFLSDESDFIAGVTSDDANVVFRNGQGFWTDAELVVLDEALGRLQDGIGNTRLLRDSVADSPLVLIKGRTLPFNGPRVAENVLAQTSETQFNPDTGEFELITTFERQITFADWDETSAAENEIRVLELPREIGHNWNSPEEILSVLSLIHISEPTRPY